MNYAALTAYLEQRGLADTDGVRRKARYTRCALCGREVLQGLDADVAGLPVTTDVVDLDRFAETLVLLAGRRTFRVFELPDGLRIGTRDPTSIRAEKQPRPVVAAHRCGIPPPPSTAFRWQIPIRVTTPDGAPPF